jgi:cytochrome P450
MRGRTIEADAPVTVLWAAAQRDPRVFEDPAEFRLDRDPNDNLLYGRGPHYCPGEGLSRLELGVLLDELLLKAPAFTLAPHREPVRAVYPSGGFSEVRITLV